MATADLSPSHSPHVQAQSGAVLQSRLTVLTRRRNAQQMARHLIRASIPGLAIAAVSVALYRFHIIPDGPLWAPAAMIGASLLWGARNGWLARRGHFAAASDADSALKLDDRLSSALAFVAPDEIRRTSRVAPPHLQIGTAQKRAFAAQRHFERARLAFDQLGSGSGGRCFATRGLARSAPGLPAPL